MRPRIHISFSQVVAGLELRAGITKTTEMGSVLSEGSGEVLAIIDVIGNLNAFWDIWI